MSVKTKLAGILRRLKIPFLQTEDQKNLMLLSRAIGGKPRYEPGNIKIGNVTIDYVDAPSLISAYDVVVVKRHNDFVTSKTRPLILDCGANIGIATLHYKRLFPEARIIAFEPDEKVCRTLKRNLSENGASDVEIVEAAVWISDGETKFLAEGSDAGRISEENHSQQSKNSSTSTMTTVRTVDFRKYLDQKIDFVKLDIEGAESTVLQNCVDKLSNVSSMIIEVHISNERPKELAIIMDALSAAKFNVSVNSYGNWIDLTNRETIARNEFEYDQYLLLCCWRTNMES